MVSLFFFLLNTVESCSVLASPIQRNIVLALSHIVGDLKPELYKRKKNRSLLNRAHMCLNQIIEECEKQSTHTIRVTLML